MDQNNSSSKTLLMSVVMSAPGPLVVALGLLKGKSSTQIADFVRRSAELLGIIMAYVVYKITTKNGVCDEEKRRKLERLSNVFVGAMMCLGGIIMLILAFANNTSQKGNVVPGLIIALLGVVANTLFWRKYTKLNKERPNSIIAVQARLYRAKSMVDSCVSVALLSVLILPNSMISHYLDFCGSIVVSVYLTWCGVRTVGEGVRKKVG